MDERLRAIERNHTQQPTSDSLYHLLNWYAKSMPIPEADIRILNLIAMGAGFKPRGPKGSITHWLSPELLRDLYAKGYEAGVYFVTKEPHSDDNLVIETLVEALRQANRLMVGHTNYDSIDRIDTGPGNAYARDILPSGEERWVVNFNRIRHAAWISDEEWKSIHQLLLSFYKNIARSRNNIPHGRFFIPAWLLEACFAFPVNQYVQGMSRSTRRNRTSSRIDWNSEGKAGDVRSRLYLLVNRDSAILGANPKDFGLNLFLAIDNSTRRTLADRWKAGG